MDFQASSGGTHWETETKHFDCFFWKFLGDYSKTVNLNAWLGVNGIWALSEPQLEIPWINALIKRFGLFGEFLIFQSCGWKKKVGGLRSFWGFFLQVEDGKHRERGRPVRDETSHHAPEGAHAWPHRAGGEICHCFGKLMIPPFFFSVKSGKKTFRSCAPAVAPFFTFHRCQNKRSKVRLLTRLLWISDPLWSADV